MVIIKTKNILSLSTNKTCQLPNNLLEGKLSLLISDPNKLFPKVLNLYEFWVNRFFNMPKFYVWMDGVAEENWKYREQQLL